METERNKNTGDSAQINFKLSPQERESIEKSAEKAGVTISEYCRIKCLLDEDEAFALKTKTADLEKTVKELRIKLSFYKDTERDPSNIILQLKPDQRKILETLYSGFNRWYTDNIGQDVLAFLIHITMFEPVFGDLFSDKGLTKTEIEDAFYPEEEDTEV